MVSLWELWIIGKPSSLNSPAWAVGQPPPRHFPGAARGSLADGLAHRVSGPLRLHFIFREAGGCCVWASLGWMRENCKEVKTNLPRQLEHGFVKVKHVRLWSRVLRTLGHFYAWPVGAWHVHPLRARSWSSPEVDSQRLAAKAFFLFFFFFFWGGGLLRPCPHLPKILPSTFAPYA